MSEGPASLRSNDDDDDDDDDPWPLRHVGFSRVRRGWEGESLELEREAPEKSPGKSSAAAVDLEQFRNHQIGVGYQAKHVIRQKTAPKDAAPSTIVVSERTTRKEEEEDTKEASKPKKKKKKRNVEATQEKSRSLQQYLQSPGMRTFRKELASIESTTPSL